MPGGLIAPASTDWEEKVKDQETKDQVTIRREDLWSQGNEHFEEVSWHGPT